MRGTLYFFESLMLPEPSPTQMSNSSAGSMAVSMQSHVPAPTPDEIANMVVDLAGLNAVRNKHLLYVMFNYFPRIFFFEYKF